MKKELEEWKSKARKIRAEWDSLKARYSQLEKDHAAMIKDIEHCQKHREDCKKENIQLNSKITAAEAENRELKTKLIHAERYKELAENAMSFNRKLNEERKMRIPYVDGQVGVALVVIYFNYIVQFSTANPAA